ncbi:Uncharacterised protein [Bordetella pertussis]|nr:Uncharacterised protein [Bordetella pertussis]
MHLGALGRDPHFFRAIEGQRAQVTRCQAVGAHHFALGLVEGVAVVRQRDLVDVGRIEQAVGVVLQPEDGGAGRGFVGAHAFEDGQSVVEGVGQHVRGGLAPRHQLAVIPDEAVAVRHRHDVLPL